MLRLSAVLLVAPALWGAGREFVVIDTDSGLFGDDGAAVTMLLRSPSQIVVPAITIVPGNVWSAQGLDYMLHILELLKRPQVAVHTGARGPLVHTAAMAHEAERRWGKLAYLGAFADDAKDYRPAATRPAERKSRRDGAVELLIAEIERHPGEMTILAIGPMTNIALALRLKPEIETRIKQIVFMGGNVGVGGNASSSAEFNFWFDPEAAQIVLRSRIPRKIMFSLDICNKAPLHKAEFDQIAAAHTPLTELFREDLGNRYPGFLKHPAATSYMWDSLAAAYLLDPGFVTRSEPRFLDVLTAWGRFYGSTVPLDRRTAPEATPVTVMMDLDFKRAFALYKDRLTRTD